MKLSVCAPRITITRILLVLLIVLFWKQLCHAPRLVSPPIQYHHLINIPIETVSHKDITIQKQVILHSDEIPHITQVLYQMLILI